MLTSRIWERYFVILSKQIPQGRRFRLLYVLISFFLSDFSSSVNILAKTLYFTPARRITMEKTIFTQHFQYQLDSAAVSM